MAKPGFKRWLWRLWQMSWLLATAALLALFIWLQPMPGNFLHYLFWKYTASNPDSGMISHEGAQIYYAAYGQGEPLLLLHGGLSNKLSWFSQLPWLVTSGRRVILIDTRGHGDSTVGHAPLSYEIFAADVLLVLDKLDIPRTDMVGWSDGGIIALLLGLEAPQRVGKIVAISANFHPSGLVDDNGPPDQRLNTFTDIFLSDRLRSWWSGAGDHHASLAVELNALWHSSPQWRHTHLQAISSPTLVITGEHDLIDLPHSGELAQMLANGKIEVVLGAGHASAITHAAQVNRLIGEFLGIPLQE